MQRLSRFKLELQNHMCKPSAIFSAICRHNIAGVSNMQLHLVAASGCHNKNCLCKWALKFIGSFQAATFSFTNLFFPPSHFSLLSSGHTLCCLPQFAPTASRKHKQQKNILSVLSATRSTRVD